MSAGTAFLILVLMSFFAGLIGYALGRLIGHRDGKQDGYEKGEQLGRELGKQERIVEEIRKSY